MSNALFPKMSGQGWSVLKRPMFFNLVTTTASGNEVRIANYPYARFQYQLKYEALPSAAGYISGVTNDFQTLFGFYCARNGNFDSFLFDESDHTASQTDSSVVGQIIGTGNGSTTSFQMQRTLGPSTRPIYAINSVIASNPPTGAPVPKIYLNGVQQGGGYSISTTGLLTFSAPPGGGVAITADFSYFFRCRFMDPMVEFENFVQNLWSLKSIDFQEVRA
jgi:uncharacterized protein (TIGR02217 family)